MTAPPYLFACLVTLFSGWAADRWKQRMLSVLLPNLLAVWYGNFQPEIRGNNADIEKKQWLHRHNDYGQVSQPSRRDTYVCAFLDSLPADVNAQVLIRHSLWCLPHHGGAISHIPSSHGMDRAELRWLYEACCGNWCDDFFFSTWRGRCHSERSSNPSSPLCTRLLAPIFTSRNNRPHIPLALASVWGC